MLCRCVRADRAVHLGRTHGQGTGGVQRRTDRSEGTVRG